MFRNPLVLEQLRKIINSQSSARFLHSSFPRLFPDVLVPPLGESITEGTIAALLKNPGDKVATDDTIAQLETDKVTVDCRSPHAGILESYKVKPGDTVAPGAVVAAVGQEGQVTASSSNTQAAQATPPPAPPPPPQAESKPSYSKTPSVPQGDAAQGAPAAGNSTQAADGKPGISFPKRMTEDGRRISELPAAEQDALCQSESQPKAIGEQPFTFTTARPLSSILDSKPAEPPKPVLPVSPSTTYLDAPPPRAKPTKLEMEAINSGGAL